MPNNTTNNPHIRLARIAFPASDPESWRGGTNSTVNNGIGRFFDPASLDSLAICERRVCEAGRAAQAAYSHEIRVVLREHGEYPSGGSDGSRTLAVRTMKPERIVSALLAFLDAHPAVEERLAAGE